MPSYEFFQIFIYMVFSLAVIAYATLDGFDLGVGCLHLFARTDHERRLMLNAIGPVWDGNTTWIVVGGGVLFAGFPKVFGIIMSGFYTPVMCIIFGFMLRGAAVEFRSKHNGVRWRKLWDFSFFFASLLLASVFGMLLGHLVEGLPLDAHGRIEGGFSSLIKPYPMIIMFFALSLFMMHGSIFLLMKLEGEFHDRLRVWVKRLVSLFIIFWIIASLATFIMNPHMVDPILAHPWLWIFAVLSLASISAIPYMVATERDGTAFICSSLSIILLLVLFVIGTFPYLLRSTLDPAYSLTLFNSSVTKTALMVLTLVSMTGFPLSFLYGTYLYKAFRGKVRLDSHSY